MSTIQLQDSIKLLKVKTEMASRHHEGCIIGGCVIVAQSMIEMEADTLKDTSSKCNIIEQKTIQ